MLLVSPPHRPTHAESSSGVSHPGRGRPRANRGLISSALQAIRRSFSASASARNSYERAATEMVNPSRRCRLAGRHGCVPVAWPRPGPLRCSDSWTTIAPEGRLASRGRGGLSASAWRFQPAGMLVRMSGARPTDPSGATCGVVVGGSMPTGSSGARLSVVVGRSRRSSRWQPGRRAARWDCQRPIERRG